MANKTLNLKLGELFLVREVVGSAGWAVTINDIYMGGKLLNDVIPEGTPIKAKEELDVIGAPFEVTDKQADIIKKALKYSIEKGVLFPSKYVASVLDTFGMVE
jgi:hypothetical protein